MFATLFSVSLLALPQIVTAASTFEEKSLAFRPEKYVDGATRNILPYVKAGTTLSFLENDATCNRVSQAVSADLCRIALEIKTSGTSKIAFEVWFPENWSGPLLATGNGGIDGCKLSGNGPYTSRHSL
jgi:feruloyl esterase